MAGTRPFSRRQALENAAFLEALRPTGNARLAARSLGVHRSTYLKRRTPIMSRPAPRPSRTAQGRQAKAWASRR